MTSVQTTDLYNLIGRGLRHDVIDADPLLAEKLRENQFSARIKDFCQELD